MKHKMGDTAGGATNNHTRPRCRLSAAAAAGPAAAACNIRRWQLQREVVEVIRLGHILQQSNNMTGYESNGKAAGLQA
jgi:hypothetical protein